MYLCIWVRNEIMKQQQLYFSMAGLRRNLGFLLISFSMINCNDNTPNIEEENRIIRQQFDSVNKKLDSMNNKIEKGIDSAIRDIDSLLEEVKKKK
jgi:hypothetical protein